MSESFTGAGSSRPYRGTAWYYAEYRPVISDEFGRWLAATLGWSLNERIIDLGTGPGQVAIRLSPYVGEILAVDPEPDMLAEGERRASAAGVGNVGFLQGSSENLSILGEPNHQYRAVTISQAFHWMQDQDRVLRALDNYLHPTDGAVVIVNYDVGQPAIAKAGDDVRPWRDRPPWSLVGEVLERYLAGVPEGPHPRGRHDPFPDILGRSAFSRLRFLRYEYEQTEEPSLEAALGFHYSLSHVLSRLGNRRPAFEAEVAGLLADADYSAVHYRSIDSALIALRPAASPRSVPLVCG